MIKFLWFFMALIIVLAVGFSVYLQPNSFALCPNDGKPVSREGCGSVDAIIAISGGDTTARTQHAIDLYNAGWAPLLIFSGAAQDKSGPSNAEAMSRQALQAGVPASAIVLEEQAENTEQNATRTNELLAARGVKQVILVTSGYHQRRASLEFHKMLNDDVVIQNSPTTDKDWQWYWWVTPRGWWLALSEFVKIIGFYVGASR